MKIRYNPDATIRTCKSCKHYRWNSWQAMWRWITENKPRCYRTLPSARIDVVSGKVHNANVSNCNSCTDERDSTSSNSCGEDAKFWVPRHKKDLFELVKHTEDLNTK